MANSGNQPVVFITPEALVRVDGPWVKLLKEAGFEVRFPEDAKFTRGVCGEAETIRVLSDAAAVIAGGEHFTPAVIDALKNLRIIARCGVGYDRVDVNAATAHGIPLTITPKSNHESVAETTFALILAVAKGIVINDKRTRSGQWARVSPEPIRGKTLGIFGLGRIGRSTAIRARVMGMNVIATETYPDLAFAEKLGIRLVDFDTLLANSDYLTLHCPLNHETKGMFNRSVFQRMKPGSVLINTARGGLVVEADLLQALTSGPLSGAGLDVFEVEPASADNPLFKLDNIVVSPHLGGVDKLSQSNMAIESAENIIQLSRNEWPHGAVVNDTLRVTWKW
jgi:D-3-phosphoglycerate dehydrogenase